MNNFAALASFFPKVPNLKVLVLGGHFEIKSSLEEFLASQECSIDFFAEYKRLIDRHYEVAIILESVSPRVLKDVYHSLENSGNLLVIVEKSNYDLEDLKNLIDNAEYRAVNEIEISQSEHVVSAKKMHMWGNGY